MAIGDQDLARRLIDRFTERFGAPYRLLACHAALPLVLTPDLLNYLRNTFLRGQVSWVAEADLLLSDLCTEVGYEQYAMKTPVRALLITEMRKDPTLGVGRMQAVARLLVHYLHQMERDQSLAWHERRAQHWAALVYIDDRRVAREIAESIRDSAVPPTSP